MIKSTADSQGKNETGKKRILSQISRPLIIFIVFIIFFNSLALFAYNIKRHMDERYDSAAMLTTVCALEMKSYRSLTFLIDYWVNNYEDMDLDYDSDSIRAKEIDFYESTRINDDLYRITSEEAYAFNADEQKLFAEICYGRMSGVMDKMKNIYEPKYLYVFTKPDENNNSIYLLTGTRHDEKRISQGGELFELGTVKTYKEGDAPALDYVLATGKIAPSMELSFGENLKAESVHTFVPVTADGEFLAVVGISLEWRNIIKEIIAFSILLIVAQAMLLALILLWTRRLIRKYVHYPINNQKNVIRMYEADKDVEKATNELAKINSNNEIEELSESFSSMLTELDRYVGEVKAVTAEKERIGAELDVARQIQANMLPSIFPAFPDRKEFDIYASMTPAKEVGGDLYDFFLIDDDHLGLVIADVSGKGVPAALFMTVSKTLLKGRMLEMGSPKEILETVNNMLCENNEEGMFVTIWIGILEISTGKLTAANAGHEYPAVRKADGEFTLLKDKHGMVAGLAEDIEYTEYELTLDKGDTIFVYTDGVPEATRADNEMFGLERMVDALNKDADASPEVLLANIMHDVGEFVAGAPSFDDLTMLCVKYHGTEE